MVRPWTLLYLQGMEIVVDVVEAAERLEELIGRACAGDKVSISVNGIPLAMLVPLISFEEFQRLGAD